MKKETCKICEGKGFVEKKFKTIIERTTGCDLQQCPYCNGYGFTIKKNKWSKPN